MDWLNRFDSVWSIDFEFSQPPGNRPSVGCLVGATSDQIGGCIGGCISGVSGAIEGKPENEETPVSLRKTGVSIVVDSRGNHYLMGVEGLEPPTPSV